MPRMARIRFLYPWVSATSLVEESGTFFYYAGQGSSLERRLDAGRLDQVQFPCPSPRRELKRGDYDYDYETREGKTCDGAPTADGTDRGTAVNWAAGVNHSCTYRITRSWTRTARSFLPSPVKSAIKASRGSKPSVRRLRKLRSSKTCQRLAGTNSCGRS